MVVSARAVLVVLVAAYAGVAGQILGDDEASPRPSLYGRRLVPGRVENHAHLRAGEEHLPDGHPDEGDDDDDGHEEDVVPVPAVDQPQPQQELLQQQQAPPQPVEPVALGPGQEPGPEHVGVVRKEPRKQEGEQEQEQLGQQQQQQQQQQLGQQLGQLGQQEQQEQEQLGEQQQQQQLVPQPQNDPLPREQLEPQPPLQPIPADEQDKAAMDADWLPQDDPGMDVRDPTRVPLLVAVALAVAVLLFRRDRRRQVACDRVVGWAARRLAVRVPCFRRAMEVLPFKNSSAFSLTKSKYSESPAGPRQKPSPLEPETTRSTEMSWMRREYRPRRRGVPANFRSVVDDAGMTGLVNALPTRLTAKDWVLLYASDLHGYNLLAAYERASGAGPFLLVVMDTNRHVFGAFCSESLRSGGRSYYGTGEAFLFKLKPELRVHKWSGGNDNVVVSTNDMIAFGGGGKFALWLDPFFNHGSSEEGSTTFEKYACLASGPMFKCSAVEIWGFASPSLSPKRTRKQVGQKAL